MSDDLHHHCGLAMIRLKKPLTYYHQRYGSALWGLRRLFLMMEKQHNRGQDAAGIAALRLEAPAGSPYVAVERAVESPPWQVVIQKIEGKLQKLLYDEPDLLEDPVKLQARFPFAAELLMGHLRYTTYSSLSEDMVHPLWRENNWRSRSLLMAGNFNLTNTEALFQKLIALGQHPRVKSDLIVVMERTGHFLDEAVDELVARLRKEENLTKEEITQRIPQELDLFPILKEAAQYWDGGYALGGLIGHGEYFVMRDPAGIRPAYYYEDDEVVAMASERPALITAFNAPVEQVQELPPAHAMRVKRDGTLEIGPFMEAAPQPAHCSFERIYFSRGNDPAIYQERLELGRQVVPEVLHALEGDLQHAVFTFIPNTAQIAYWGMLKGLEDVHNAEKAKAIQALGSSATAEDIQRILSERFRAEHIVIKDTKLRTFITEEGKRDVLAAHVYDITQGTLQPGVDTLVAIDDSIVRGTTLRQSILKILSRLRPKKIIIISSAPQIRYPDCYGIDMSQIGRMIAFQAAIALLKENGMEATIEGVYQSCSDARAHGTLEAANHVKGIYEPFTERQINAKISELLTTPDLGCAVQILYQPLANLRKAIPHHTGDWYFSGNYPTPGGNRVANQAFLNYYEGSGERGY